MNGNICMAMYDMYGYVCMAVCLCMYGYVCMAMYVWLCMYGCMPVYIWLCMYGYVCMYKDALLHLNDISIRHNLHQASESQSNQ